MKNILITGISRGLGLENAARLLEKSNEWSVYGVSRSMTDELQALMLKYPDRLFWKSFDLRKIDEIEETIFDNLLDGKQKLDAFINNAAVLYKDLIMHLKHDQMHDMILTNLSSPMVLTKTVIRRFMKDRVRGNIIHMSSICVHRSFEGLSMISATKAGVEVFSRGTAFEYGRFGIRSNVIVIGLMDLGMKDTVDTKREQGLKNIASLKELTRLESVLGMIDFLLSDQSVSITGQNIHINSGII